MNSELNIIAEAEFTALTTLDRVKAELSISGDEYDALLTAKIEEATSDIAIRVRPALGQDTLVETIRPDVDRFGCPETIDASALYLRRFPISSIASVRLDGGDALDAADYFHTDAGARIPVGALRRLSSGSPATWCFSQSAVIEYTAGYLLPGEENRNLPASLEAACIELVASYWASRGRDPMLRSETNEGVASFTYWVGAVGPVGDLPPGVMAKIAPFMVGGMVG